MLRGSRRPRIRSTASFLNASLFRSNRPTPPPVSCILCIFACLSFGGKSICCAGLCAVVQNFAFSVAHQFCERQRCGGAFWGRGRAGAVLRLDVRDLLRAVPHGMSVAPIRARLGRWLEAGGL
jgi:hypothetical protein